MTQSDNPFLLNNKRFLITGAASGIGKETSITLSKLGADLILLDINLDGLLETLDECKSTDRILVFDLLKAEHLKSELLSVISDSGKLNGFVHLAGKPYLSPLKTITRDKSNEIFSLNTYSVLEIAKAFINKDICAGSGGSVVLVSSVYALVGCSANVGYAMSKSALHGITRSLSIELAPKNIRVNCVAPGFVRTTMMDSIDSSFDNHHNDLIDKLHPLGIGSATDVANSIAFLLSDAARWITGSILSVDGGFTAQ